MPLDQLGPDDTRSYHAYLLEDRKLAANTVVLNVCALRFLYIKVLKLWDMKEALPYPKQRQRLPVDRHLVVRLPGLVIARGYIAVASLTDARRPSDCELRGASTSMVEVPSTDAELNRLPTDQDFGRLQLTTLLYYLHETNPDNWLVRDKTDPSAPVSIAALGMALATVPVNVERVVVTREFAAKVTRRRLRYLLECPQGPEPDASGYRGFFYHFLDIETGRRVWQCELSTIDSAFLFAGALTVATFFDRDTAVEAEIRQLASELYERADWNWACNGGPTLTHGWRPESGFIPRRPVALHNRPGFTDASAAVGKLCRLLRDLRMEEHLRSRVAVFGAVVYAPTVAHVDRLSRHPGRLHARPRDRLFREHAASNVRATGVRDSQPEGVRRLRAILLGIHGM